MALGAFFSAAEVIPLTFLTVEAWSFLQLGAQQQAKSRTPFPHYWAVMFLVSVGFWNFLGAGVFGFLINLPVVSLLRDWNRSDFKPRTCGHDGCLWDAGGWLGAVLHSLHDSGRAMVGPSGEDQLLVIQCGLAWMVFATLFPLGLLQLYESVNHGYFEARSLKFIGNPVNAFIEWLRFPGDVVFIVGGVLPILYLCWLAVRSRVVRTTLWKTRRDSIC